MSSTVYIETSIIGYLTSRPSRDLLTAANRQLTHDWWKERRGHFDIEAVCRLYGYEPPIICTPQELMEA